MISVPKYIENTKNYSPSLTVDEIVKKYDLNKISVLWNNENNYGFSKKINNHIKLSDFQLNRYFDPLNIQLRGKISSFYNLSIDNVIIGNGSEGLLQNVIRSFCSFDDEVLTFNGTFVMIYLWSNINNTSCKKLKLSENYKYDIKKISSNITKRTKIIYIASPNNPTGQIIKKNNFQKLMTTIPKNILVILDEAYYEYAKAISDEYPNSLDYDFENLVILRTFSKAYGLASLRIGYAISKKIIIDSLLKVKLTFETSILSQKIAMMALDDQVFINNVTRNNSIELEKYYRFFNDNNINFFRSFGNFIMIDLSSEKKSKELYLKLLKKGVFVRLLNAFGLPNCLRITIGTSDENEYCIQIFKKILSKL
ncbi:MAG: histidinol-phosphate transaminase [Flavobacteriales bacterium]|nr:histidinol-phosphate transaminase [Flavobacteriales bacterium]|tara:strand:+ start:24 stop:1124 length:1101 start_codon:yes stop_codon:yes gene_type:complete